MRPFIIYALPRSRTYWLSRFLSFGGWHCGHDELRHVRSLQDVKTWFSQPYTGTAETLAAPWWRLVQSVCPDIRTVVIRRPVAQVVDSLMARASFDRAIITNNMTKLDHKLDQIEARVPGVLSVSFDDLATASACAALFPHCLGLPFSRLWWQDLSGVNLQSDLAATLRYMQAYEPQLAKVAQQAKYRVLTEMSQRPLVETDGLTIQQEDFETALRDGEALFAEHAAVVDEVPDSFRGKNLPLMRALNEKGFIQVTTARCNGRMFGYLMALVGPSLESPTSIEALNTLFYASPVFRGLGMKLQRASADALRAKGVDVLYCRAGIRGSGHKIGAIYRRMGGEECGEMYRVKLRSD